MGSVLLALALPNMCFQQTEAMTEFIQSSQVLNSPEQQLFAVDLVRNALARLAVEPQGCGQHGALLEMAVHVAAVLLCGQSPVLQPLRNLALQPHTMQVRARSSPALQHLPASGFSGGPFSTAMLQLAVGAVKHWGVIISVLSGLISATPSSGLVSFQGTSAS